MFLLLTVSPNTLIMSAPRSQQKKEETIKVLPYRWEHLLLIDSTHDCWFPYNYKENIYIEYNSTEGMNSNKHKTMYKLSNQIQIVFEFNRHGHVLKSYEVSYENGKEVRYEC